MNILITGGAGFIGSHAAEYYARKNHRVTVYDNLSRARLLERKSVIRFGWDFLRSLKRVKLVQADVCDARRLEREARGKDVILHCAGQTAVTTSVTDPRTDFEINALGTFNVLEAARKSGLKPTVLFCSTNKVYGERVNELEVEKDTTRYVFGGKWAKGIPEDFGVDLCHHSPYGCSKLTGDMYMQDYASRGIKIGVFRMSCIYGTRQFGVEDQGWIAWFTIASLLKKPLSIYGDGLQVRDVLYVTDLIDVYDRFIKSRERFGVYNIGGGPGKSVSLKELVAKLEKRLGRKIPLRYGGWRPSDQKVYISDIRKAKAELGWRPKVTFDEGLDCLLDWVRAHESIFVKMYGGRR